TDGGASWNSVNHGIADAEVWQVQGSINGVAFARADNGLYRTTDGGTHWSIVSINGPVARADVFPDGLILVSGYGSILRSEDNGESWQTAYTALSYPVDQFRRDERGMLYALSFGVVLASADGGATWKPTSSYYAEERFISANANGNLF